MKNLETQFASWLGDSEPSPETEFLTQSLDALYAGEPDEALIQKVRSELDEVLKDILVG